MEPAMQILGGKHFLKVGTESAKPVMYNMPGTFKEQQCRQSGGHKWVMRRVKRSDRWEVDGRDQFTQTFKNFDSK